MEFKDKKVAKAVAFKFNGNNVLNQYKNYNRK